MFEKLKQIYNSYTPKFIKDKIHLLKWNYAGTKIKHDILIKSIREKTTPIKVLFIASNLPMWRNQRLYELLKNDKRFNPVILVVPFRRYDEVEAKKNNNVLKEYFEEKKNNFVCLDSNEEINKFINSFSPDIFFPTQQYQNIYGNRADYEHNLNRLVCYIPYGLITIVDEFVYNTQLHNLCWKVFLPTNLHYKTAKRMMANNAKNVCIVGDPRTDDLLERGADPWKIFKDGKKRKKLIWAPHFSIEEDGLLHRASFLWLCKEMQKIAKDYENSIQLAFKPHPMLYNVLVKRWGIEKTEQYYNFWRNSANTQLEEGNYTDLFAYSDAMIHDCGSFTGEYMFTQKPVMFVTKDKQNIFRTADEFGKECLNLHYFGDSIIDVRRFVDLVVLNDNDALKEHREIFFKNHLQMPNNQSFAQNVYNQLLNSLGLKE